MKHADPRSSQAVHLAASHRLLRTRKYPDPRLAAHFRVFSLCSAGRDRGGFEFERESIAMHIEFYVAAIRAFAGPSVPLRVLVTPLERSDALDSAVDALLERVRLLSGDLDVEVHPERTAGGQYYRSLCFWIYATDDRGEARQLVDGGSVDWTRRLLSDAKERLVISGAGSDRIVTLSSTRQIEQNS
jgi:hypothetical protein